MWKTHNWSAAVLGLMMTDNMPVSFSCILNHYAMVSSSGCFCIFKFLLDSSFVLGVAQIQTSQSSIVYDYAPGVLHLAPASEPPGGPVKTDCWVPPWFWLSMYWITGGAWEFVFIMSSQEMLIQLIWGPLVQRIEVETGNEAVMVWVLALPLTCWTLLNACTFMCFGVHL